MLALICLCIQRDGDYRDTLGCVTKAQRYSRNWSVCCDVLSCVKAEEEGGGLLKSKKSIEKVNSGPFHKNSYD